MKKTTLKKRLLRLGILCASIMGLIIGAVSTMCFYVSDNTKGGNTGEQIARMTSGVMYEEFSFVSESLGTITPTDETSVFEDVFYIKDTPNEYKTAAIELSSLTTDEFNFSAPVEIGGHNYICAGYGKPEGVIIGVLPYEYFDAIVNSLVMHETDIGYIVNANGKIILSNSNPDMIGTDLSEDKQFGPMLKDSTEGITDWEVLTSELTSGIQMQVTYFPIEDTDYTVVYGTDYGKNVLGGYYNSVFVTVLLYLILSGVAIVISNNVANKITTPLIEATNRIRGLASGDINSPVAIAKTGDETEVLTEALSNTTDQLSSYIQDIAKTLSEISNGNLCVEDTLSYQGDFANIKASLSEIQSSLKNTFANVQMLSRNVNNNASSLADSAENLAENSSAQASTIEELNAMAEGINTKVNATAENTKKAAEISNKAINDVQNGSVQVDQLVKAMNMIQTAAEEIQKVTKIIDDIAFQTNILALNASVEAARAGENGRGFAVVADEVRNLAGKSAEAVSHTSELIDKCVDAVKSGSDITNRVQGALEQIHDAVDQDNQIIEKIAEDSNEQASALGQINVGLNQITGTIQQNSASSQESAAAAAELKNTAEQLNEEVAKFKIQ